jgi:hypothetical protein
MLVTTIFILRHPPVSAAQPSVRNRRQRLGSQKMKLVSSIPVCRDQPRRLQHIEMLRNTLTRRTNLMLHRQSRADLKECLAIALRQLVKNRPPHRRNNRFEDIAHGTTIGKL